MIERNFVTEEEVNASFFETPTHYNFKSKVGQRFGKLQVLKLQGATDGKNKEYQYYCKCDCGSYLIRRSSNLNNRLTRSCGCDINSHKKLTLVEMLDRAGLVEYEVLESKEGFESIWKFKCKEHGDFYAKYCDIVYRGCKCRKCSEYGYRANLPGYFYVNSIELDSKLICFKIGITNLDPTTRASQLQNKAKVQVKNLASLYFENGEDALTVEHFVKSNFNKFKISKEILPVGFTETIRPDQINLLIYILSNLK